MREPNAEYEGDEDGLNHAARPDGAGGPAPHGSAEDDETGRVVDLTAAREQRMSLAKWGDDEPVHSGDQDAEVLSGVVLDADSWVRAAPHSGVRTRREVVPGWLRDRAAVSGLVRETLDRAWRTAAFHTLRVPAYWWRLARCSPRGTWRVTCALSWWMTDTNGRRVRRGIAEGSVIGSSEVMAFHRVSEQHRQQVRIRMGLTAAVLLAVVLGGWAFVASAPLLVVVGAALLAVAVSGGFGRKADQRIVGSAISATSRPKFTSDLIVTALGSLGIAELNKHLRPVTASSPGGEGVRFAGPIHRDGPGWRADLDLPPGVTAGDVVERRDRLASGLRRPLGCVWPEPDAEQHAGRLILWVGDKALSAGKPVSWPLAKTGRVSLFAPFPVGVDQRGRPATLTLMFASMVIGAVPRVGKTFFLRLLLLAAALDATAELHVYDLKGSGDLSPLEAVAHRYACGDEPEDLDYLMADLRTVHRDMSRRYKTLRGLPREVCPENKVTPELAARSDLGLHPLLVAIDECQFLFEHGAHGKEAEALITDLVKRGPAVGVMTIVATQRPDAKSLPTGISANAALRFCLRVMGQVENDMVLGTSMYKAGIRATTFTRTDRGVGYLVGDGAEPVIVRGAYLDAPAAEVVAARARTARLAAGRLSGHAAGLQPDTDDTTSITVLDDLAGVMATGPTREWSENLVERLADLRPDAYGTWAASDLGAAVAPFGIDTVQIGRRVGGKVVNRRGLDRTDVHRALTEREGRRATGTWTDGPVVPPEAR